MADEPITEVVIAGRKITPEFVNLVDKYLLGIASSTEDIRQDLFLAQNNIITAYEEYNASVRSNGKLSQSFFFIHEFISELEILIKKGKF